MLLLPAPIYRWGNCGTGKLKSRSQVTEVGVGRARVCSQSQAYDRPSSNLPVSPRSLLCTPVVKAGFCSGAGVYSLLILSCHERGRKGDFSFSPLHPAHPFLKGHFSDDQSLYCAPASLTVSLRQVWMFDSLGSRVKSFLSSSKILFKFWLVNIQWDVGFRSRIQCDSSLTYNTQGSS